MGSKTTWPLWFSLYARKTFVKTSFSFSTEERKSNRFGTTTVFAWTMPFNSHTDATPILRYTGALISMSLCHHTSVNTFKWLPSPHTHTHTHTRESSNMYIWYIRTCRGHNPLLFNSPVWDSQTRGQISINITDTHAHQSVFYLFHLTPPHFFFI